MRLRKLTFPLVAAALSLALATTGVASPLVAPTDASTTDANITRLTTNILERSQFAHRRLDDALAGTFFDRYLDSLDASRSLFVQTDVDELGAYRSTLAQATRGQGDTRAARAVFNRFLERLAQRAAFVDDTLHTAAFDFAGHDVYSYDRESAQRPRDLAAAQELWRQQLRADYLQEKLAHRRPEQIVSTLTQRYTQQLRTMKGLGADRVLEVYLDTLAHVYDPHSDYMGHAQLESFGIAMNLSLIGIGATLENADGYCKVRELVPGGPAARSGLLKPGDRIVTVGQASKAPVDVVNMPLDHVVELIRGPKGSTVVLQILPAGAAEGSAPKTAAIVRDEVKLEDQEAKAHIVDLPMGKAAPPLRLGVIDLPSFYADMGAHEGSARRSATADVARLLAKLKAEHVRGIVLDLRRNGGGSLEEAITLTGLFIRTGPVVQTRDPSGEIDVGADNDPSVAYDGPLVVLTSRFSASASEIMAGALQDYGRALVVGDSSTFGKGTVQNIVPLARVMDQAGMGHSYDPGALKVTTNKFYRPSGASTQLRGVAADIVLPSRTDFSAVSESALKDPLPWDVVPSASYDHLDRVQAHVADLREKSARRIAAEKSFGYLAGDIARIKQNLATKSVSLNEAERRREMAEDKARNEERERQERAAGPASSPTTYEITLRNAASPGLPAPVRSEARARTPTTAASSALGDVREPIGRWSPDDITLNEAERILADYVAILERSDTR